MLPRPLFGLSPAAARSSPYRSNTSGRKARTTWPKMIGSETFIMVAFRCTENSTPSALARAICAARNSSSAATCMAVASTTSPASTGTDSLSTVVEPSSPTSSIRSDPSLSITAEVSLERKSSAVMCATLVLESGDQAPIECGWFRAYCLTDAGARRSELPSRSTGLTALPLTLS